RGERHRSQRVRARSGRFDRMYTNADRGEPRLPFGQRAAHAHQRGRATAREESAAEGVEPEVGEARGRVTRVAPGRARGMLAPRVERRVTLRKPPAAREHPQPEIEILRPAQVAPAAGPL